MNKNRFRIFLVLKYLFEYSDDKHYVTTTQIRDFLSKYDIKYDRKTFKDDIDFLVNEMEYDIICKKGSPNRYCVGDRFFELPELALLVDTISSSQFISVKKSRLLIDKLLRFASIKQRNYLNIDIINNGKTKTDNNNVYFIVDQIKRAINDKKKISFKYYEYNNKKEKIYKNNGEIYIVSPYYLYCNLDKYYIVAYSDKRETIVCFRIDRMENPVILKEDIVEKPDDFSIKKFGNRIFCMFPGEETEVEIECKNDLMKYVIDKLGYDVDVVKRTKDTFNIRVKVGLSPTFYAWIFQFEGNMKIISPKNARREFMEMLSKNLTRK